MFILVQEVPFLLRAKRNSIGEKFKGKHKGSFF
jgi:hypothetical protein